MRDFGTLRSLGLVGLALSTLMCSSYENHGSPNHWPAVGHLPGEDGGGGGAGGDGASSSSSGGPGGSGGDAPIPAEACSFDAEVAFNLPAGYGTDALDDVGRKDEGGYCLADELSYALRDMDGDLLPDLVVTDRCESDGPEVGDSEWRVHWNEGDRFADAYVAWSLPGGFPTDGLDDVQADGDGSCAQGELSYALRDMNGDERPDLVVTDNCDLEEVGTTHWLVFENLGTGFASVALDWALPSGFASDQLDDLEGDDAGVCIEGELSMATLDLNGDRRPDLVITDNCDAAGVGTDHWLVYENLGDRFAATPTAWSLPAGFSNDNLDDIADENAGACFEGVLSFGLRDMDGDQALDLVVSDNCDVGGVGATHWLVHLNQGDRFADTPIVWDLPREPSAPDLVHLSSDNSGVCVVGELSYEVLDTDGDSAADLLVTDDCDSDGVGSTHWLLYRANLTRFEEAASWTLPAGFEFDTLDDIVQDDTAQCLQGELSTAVMDIDGDRVLDLVVADDCDVDQVGTTHWRVFSGRCE